MKSCWVFVLLLLCGELRAQIDVTDGQTAAALAATLAGKGVTILNPVLNCPSWAYGTFGAVSNVIGLDSGIVLTNGRAASKPGVYGVNGPSAYLASMNNGTPGDATLSALAGQTTLDACSLEFDVIPQGDTISFSYVFSSEEYKSAVCGPYNDVFAFFISGPGIMGQRNIALIPGTNIPVTINSINNGIPGSTGSLINCTNMGPGSPFTSFYRDNSTGQYLTHHGLTTVLLARQRVDHCSRYHLKLVVADAGNGIYDSGVFLKAGSLESESYSVAAIKPTPKDTSAFCVKGCLPGRFVIKRSKPAGYSQTVKLLTGGNAVSGFDYSPIPDSIVIPANAESADVYINGSVTLASGPRTLKLYLVNPGLCSGLTNIVDSASMIIYDTLHVSVINPDNMACVGDTIRIKVVGDSFLSYHWSPTLGLNDANAAEPMTVAMEDITYHLTALLPATSCVAKMADVTIKTRLTPVIDMPREEVLCNNATLRLSATTIDSNVYNIYLWNGPGGFTSVAKEILIAHLTQADGGLYSVVVTNDTNGCRSGGSTDVIVTTPAEPATKGNLVYCLNDVVPMLPVQGDSLRWYTSESDTVATKQPDYSTSAVANYIFFATQTIGGCESPKERVAVEVRKCCDGQIFFPTAFTPNGDGHNDQFKPIADYGYFITGVRIVNRWGQLVYSGLDGTWDGTFNGVEADAGVYFYRMIFGCIRGGVVEKQGDVTLVR